MRLAVGGVHQASAGISIHAPLAGCDACLLNNRLAVQISIHAPLAGCDISGARSRTSRRHFNPRTPCGVRRASAQRPLYRSCISIHAPLAGCDQENRRALRHLPISIHAPLAGCDLAITGLHLINDHFNPRTPCGVRQNEMVQATLLGISIHAPLAGCDSITCCAMRRG